MPGKLKRHTYDLVEETYDSKVPVHNEAAFEHGIRFEVKFIGTREIPKPASRAEIVASMRRIRYDNKVQGTKKQIATIVIGLEGLKVIRQKPKGNLFQKRKMKEFVEVELSSYPIHKIFYVSHDSQDLQIFSYIAKDDDQFKCSVFKAVSKAEAVHVVRTVGQAFEVCHKRSSTVQQNDNDEKDSDEDKQNHNEAKVDKIKKIETPSKGQQSTANELTSSPSILTDVKETSLDSANGGLTLDQLRNIYHLKVAHYKQEAESAKLSANLLTEKLDAETTARTEAQRQLEAVLKQNKELISTVQQLVAQVHNLHSQRHIIPTSHGIRHGSSTSSSMSSTPTLTPKHLTYGSARKNPGEQPALPFIPPPPITPSPNHSRHNSIDSWTSSLSGTKLPTTLDTADIEITETKRTNPQPQEFLRFVFDSPNSSDVFPSTEDNNNITADTNTEPAVSIATNHISSPINTGTPK